MKQVLFRVLVEKAGKGEDEEEVEYYLREIDLRRAALSL